MDSNQTINSVLKASEILICLCRGERKVTDIARKLKYGKTAVFRALNSFEKKGLVVKDEVTHQYFPGPFLQALAIDTSNVHDILVHVASEEMETLCHAVDETITLVIPNGAQWFSIKVVHAYQQFALPAKAGETGPIYIGALGKVLLSQFSDTDLNLLMARIKLTAFTHTTTTDKLVLLEEIKNVRKEGYCITFSEYLEGGAAIGVPITNYSCPVALCTVGFESGLTKKTELIIKHLKESRSKIEARLEVIASSSR